MEVSQAHKTKPRFTLTNWIDLTVNRYNGGQYVNGIWTIDTTPETFTVEANVQPMKYTDLLMLPESDRTKEWIKVYVALNDANHYQIRTAREGNGGWEADRFFWHSDEYKIMRIQHYEMGVLDHWKCLAAREPISAK